MLTTKYTVIKLRVRKHREKIKLQPGTLVKGLKTRLLNLCDSPFVQHITLLTLGNQKFLEGLEVIDKEVRTNKKTRGQPIVDANDVAKLLVSTAWGNQSWTRTIASRSVLSVHFACI